MTLLGWIIFLALALLMLLALVTDIVFHALKTPPIGARLHTWALHNPVYAGLAAALLGMLLGHFFWQ
jgi:hypothetical protein